MQMYVCVLIRISFQAFLQIVKMERERDEKERQQVEEERKRRREEIQRIKRMLEASFDGDIDEIKTVLKEVLIIFKIF